MSTNPDPALYNLVGKHVLIRNTTMVPQLIRGYSGVATDVYIRDDQVPFYRVKLDVVQANGRMTDIVKRLNEKCNGQNGKYLVQAAHVVQDPTPNDMYWRYQYMPYIKPVFSDDEIRAASTELVESNGNTELSAGIYKLVPATQ
jgi:hypothetical protein